MSLSLLRNILGPWELSRGFLKTDLDRIQLEINTYENTNDAKWTNLFITANPVVADGNYGKSFGIDFSKGPRHSGTLTASVTFSLLNPVDGSDYLLFINTGAGSFTAAWPSTVKWSGGTTPTITATANKTDVVLLRYVKIQKVYYGSIVQNY